MTSEKFASTVFRSVGYCLFTLAGVAAAHRNLYGALPLGVIGHFAICAAEVLCPYKPKS